MKKVTSINQADIRNMSPAEKREAMATQIFNLLETATSLKGFDSLVYRYYETSVLGDTSGEEGTAQYYDTLDNVFHHILDTLSDTADCLYEIHNSFDILMMNLPLEESSSAS